jgi:hypothetical protein
MSTLTNGMAQTGCIPSDEAFGNNVFTVLGSRLKPGCAEACSQRRPGSSVRRVAPRRS